MNTGTRERTQPITLSQTQTQPQTHIGADGDRDKDTDTGKATDTDTAGADADADADLNQNVRASTTVKEAADEENAHTQPQKCGERGTQKTLVGRGTVVIVASAHQLLFACSSAQTW